MANNVTYDVTVGPNGTVSVFLNNTDNATTDNITTTVPSPFNQPTFAKVIIDIIVPIICIFGIIGILLTIIVLSRKNMSTSTNCYLMGLAFADLFFLVIFVTRLCESFFPVQEGKAYYLFLVYITYAMVFMNIFLLMSIWITVMLAVERYIAICRPFIAVKICTVTLARIVIVFIFAMCVLCRLANFFEYKLTYVGDIVYPEQTKMARDSRYYLVYPWVVDVVITSVIPFVLLLILNVCLIWEVHRMGKVQRDIGMGHVAGNSQTSHNREEVQITIMLISVIIVFFICQAPYVIYMAINSLNGFHYSKTGIPMLVFKNITLLLLALKSAINFILYCWFSEKFWATLKRIFCAKNCCSSLKNKPGQAQNGSHYFNLKRLSSSGNTRVTLLTEHE